MDLIGGYEQLDHQREVAGLMKRLREYTREAVIRQLSSGVQPSDSLSAIEAKLQIAGIDLSELLQLIRNAATEHPRSRFADLSVECESLLQNSNPDNRARFEWVDGILVKALKQGKWIVLDNANLCNPSVLDRLNSLLEPNGSLSINEHRNPDGSAQVLKPHKDFRLFMTMDPRHGELSRAMRNRSIELYIPAYSPSSLFNVLNSSCEFTVSRFELFQAFNWTSLDDAHYSRLLTICFDHLAFSDFRLCRRWQSQITAGLSDLSYPKQSLFSSIAKAYRQMLDFDGPTLKATRGMYRILREEPVGSLGFSSMQVSHGYCQSEVFCTDRGLYMFRLSILPIILFYSPQPTPTHHQLTFGGSGNASIC